MVSSWDAEERLFSSGAKYLRHISKAFDAVVYIVEEDASLYIPYGFDHIDED
jgi:hypothetical protein